MKKQILTTAFFAILMIGGLALTASAQMITGGYGKISVKSADAKNMAAFAITQKSKQSIRKYTLVKIYEAEQQVVAGMNFKICMRVRDDRGRASTITAVVFRSLRNRRSLSDWDAGKCGVN